MSSWNISPPPPPTSLISCKSISESLASFSISYLSRQRRQVAASVAFNPSGNFDLSLYNEEDGKGFPCFTKIVVPLFFERIRESSTTNATKEGRHEVLLDNDSIHLLDLAPFHSATGITSPLSAKPKEFLERTIGFTINYTREDEHDPRELSEFLEIRLVFET
ncbi:unnamed protein product [Ilex paraguariensis]|uniref:Uncharacterized protein n=1 Tax=Ilex paraguariensis TaxID=185542 RepID=A0ABC8SWB1_9AQUA